jgi:hypothetical protein
MTKPFIKIIFKIRPVNSTSRSLNLTHRPPSITQETTDHRFFHALKIIKISHTQKSPPPTHYPLHCTIPHVSISHELAFILKHAIPCTAHARSTQQTLLTKLSLTHKRSASTCTSAASVQSNSLLFSRDSFTKTAD